MNEIESKYIKIIKKVVEKICKKIIDPREDKKMIFYIYIKENFYKLLDRTFIDLLEESKESHKEMKDILQARSDFLFYKDLWLRYANNGANGIKYNEIVNLIDIEIKKYTHIC